jgi:hypothetical protein
MPDVESMTAGRKTRSNAWQDAITVVQEVEPPVIPVGTDAMTVVEFPAGDPGKPPHRHSGPCFGDVIHYRNGNNRDDMPVRFTVTMLGEPGKPMLTFVDEEELARGKNRRATRTN